MACELCVALGGAALLWRDPQLRIVRVADADHPAYCRVIWQRHVVEMTDLAESEWLYLMRAVLAAERALRTAVRPDKINLASLGNMTPHLHWHVIARFREDARFPDSVWSPRRRDGTANGRPGGGREASVDAALRAALLRELGPDLPGAGGGTAG